MTPLLALLLILQQDVLLFEPPRSGEARETVLSEAEEGTAACRRGRTRR